MSETLNEAIRVRLTTQQREELEALSDRVDRPVGYLIRRAIRELLEREQEEAKA